MSKVRVYDRYGAFLGFAEIPDRTSPEVLTRGISAFKRDDNDPTSYHQVLAYSVFGDFHHAHQERTPQGSNIRRDPVKTSEAV